MSKKRQKQIRTIKLALMIPEVYSLCGPLKSELKQAKVFFELNRDIRKMGLDIGVTHEKNHSNNTGSSR